MNNFGFKTLNVEVLALSTQNVLCAKWTMPVGGGFSSTGNDMLCICVKRAQNQSLVAAQILRQKPV